MLGLASLLCIVSVAEATCNILPDGLAVSDKTLTPLSSLTGHGILSSYKRAMMNQLDWEAIFGFRRAYKRPALFAYVGTEPNLNSTLPPSDECYAFMRSYFGERYKRLAKCTESWYLDAYNIYNLMIEEFQNAHNRWANVTAAAENGGTWYDDKFMKNSQDSVCFGGINDKFAEILAEATANFNRHVETMTKVIHTWIPAAGKCMCWGVLCRKWAEVCHESIGLLNHSVDIPKLRTVFPITLAEMLAERYEILLNKEKEQETEETMLAKKDNS